MPELPAKFGTVQFDVLSDPHTVTWSGPATVTRIPGGNTSYIDLGGAEPPRLRLQLWLIDTSLNALHAVVGTVQVLQYVLGSTQAVLVSTSEPKREYWSGDALHAPGWYANVDAEFLLL